MLVVGLLAVGAMGAECADPVKPAELEASMQLAEDALRDLDEAGFRDRVNEVAGILLPCVGQALSPESAARYHRLMALHLHGIGDDEGARLGLSSAYALQPDVTYADDLLAADHPLRAQWDALEPDLSVRRVPEPRYGRLGFDGTIGRERPRNRPTLAQVFDESGLTVSTQYLGPREPLPLYPAIPRQRNLLIGCAGGAAATAGALYGGSWAARSSVYRLAADPKTPAADLDRARATDNALSVLSGTFFGIGLGCGVGAAVIGQR